MPRGSSRIEKNCEFCGKTFSALSSRLKENRGKFCSQKCYWTSLKGKQLPVKSHRQTIETRLKISKMLKGRVVSEDTKRKISEAKGRKGVLKDCEFCRKLFYVTPRRATTAKYCSLSCKHAASKETIGKKHPLWNDEVELTCVVCGKKKKIYASHAVSISGKYCSPKCYSIARKGKFRKEQHPRWQGEREITCTICGKKKIVPTRSASKYCSHECYSKAPKTTETIEKQHKSHLGQTAWNKDKKGVMPTPWNLGKPLPDNLRTRISNTLKGKFTGKKNPFYGKQHSSTFKEWQSQRQTKYFEKHPEARMHLKIKRLDQVFPSKDTQIEINMQEELYNRGILYEKHKNVENICQPDIVFFKEKLAIFCDGDYWHSLPKAVAKDRTQEELLKKAGWRYLRFWEKDINRNVKTCVDEIERVLARCQKTDDIRK